MRILITYATTHGQTARIAERVAERMRLDGAEVVVAKLRLFAAEPDASGFDAIVVGDRVHGDRYHYRVTHFVRRHLNALRSRPSAFFSVSLLQLSKDAVHRAKTLAIPGRTFAGIGWRPDRIEVIAGALTWPRYGLLGRFFMKTIWKKELGLESLDTTHDQVFTDWAQVDRFADEFVRSVELRQHGAPAPWPDTPEPEGPSPSATT
jgi:menaquinone-dependent protoporphyrinogen oxidase